MEVVSLMRVSSDCESKLDLEFKVKDMWKLVRLKWQWLSFPEDLSKERH